MSKGLKYRLKSLMLANNTSFDDLAYYCRENRQKVDRITIYNWSRIGIEDKKSIPADTLRLLAQYYGMSMEDMYNTESVPA